MAEAVQRSSVMDAAAQRQSKRIAAGLAASDPDILDELIEQHRGRLMRYLVHLVGRHDVAEDLFQETWMRVLQQGHRYDGRAPFDAWMLAIARNLALDFFRKRVLLSLDTLNDSTDGPPPAILSDMPTPFEEVQAQESSAAIRAVLLALNRIHREVLELHFLQDLTMREIAERTGISLATVKSRLYRAISFFQRKSDGLLTDALLRDVAAL